MRRTKKRDVPSRGFKIVGDLLKKCRKRRPDEEKKVEPSSLVPPSAPSATLSSSPTTLTVFEDNDSNDKLYFEQTKYDDDLQEYKQKWFKLLALGKGKSSEVFLVTNDISEKGERFAAKCISKDYVKMSQKNRERVNTEIIICKTSEHPNIVKFYEMFETIDDHILLFEWCSQGCLREVLKKNGPFHVEVALKFTLQAARALAYLHNKMIIHRDVKPENMLLSSKGDLKMSDFGLSARLKHPLERRNSFVGTPNYIAPEVARFISGPSEYGLSIDVWSLGVCLYMFVFNKKLFDDENGTKNVFTQIGIFQKMVFKGERQTEPRVERILTNMITLEQRRWCMEEVVKQISFVI